MRKVLFIHAGAVGDFVMSLRVVSALRLAGAECVTLLGRPEIADIAVPGGGIDAILDINVGGYHALFSPALDLPAHVNDTLRSFDLAVNMLAGPDNTVSKRLKQIGIPTVIDVDPRRCNDWTGHVTDQWLKDLRVAGIDAKPGAPVLDLGDEPIHQCERVAVLHPGSGSRQKNWPLTHFIELAQRLRDYDLFPLFLLGPVELEHLSENDLALIRRTAKTIENSPLREVAAFIASACLFVGNDSGMSHVAAAVGTRTIAVFGATDPARWRPLGRHVIVVRSDSPTAWPSPRDVLSILPL